MNVLMLVGSTRLMGMESQATGDAVAICLFVSGIISLAIAGYLSIMPSGVIFPSRRRNG